MAKKKAGGGVLMHLVILLILAAVGWELHILQGQLQQARAENQQYSRQVETLKQSNESLRADIGEGATDEKMKEIARDELGWTESDEYVFYDKQN